MIFDHQTSIWMCWHLKAMLGPTSAEVLWQRNRRVDLQKKFSPVSTFVRQDAAVANKTQESAQSWQITFYWPHNGWDNRQSPLSRFWYIIRLQTSNGFESQTRTSWFVFQVALVPEAAHAGLFSVPWSCLKQVLVSYETWQFDTHSHFMQQFGWCVCASLHSLHTNVTCSTFCLQYSEEWLTERVIVCAYSTLYDSLHLVLLED